MKRSNNLLELLNDESGATAIEYGLIVALVSVAMFGFAETMGQSISAFFSDSSTKMTNIANGLGVEGGN